MGIKNIRLKYLFIIFLFFPLKSYSEDNYTHSNYKMSFEYHCFNTQCTRQIKELEIGNFIFEAKECGDKVFYDNCIFSFGIESKMQIYKPKDYFTYRIINGPIPLNLFCIDGRPVGYADFDLSKLEGFYGVDTFSDTKYQHGEKVYYNKSFKNTFSFSGSNQNIGIMFSKWGVTGNGFSELYIYNVISGEFDIIKADCGGRF